MDLSQHKKCYRVHILGPFINLDTLNCFLNYYHHLRIKKICKSAVQHVLISSKKV